MIWKLIREAIIISLIQHFEADFLQKISLKIPNSGLILKAFTHAITMHGLTLSAITAAEKTQFNVNFWGRDRQIDGILNYEWPTLLHADKND